MVEDTNLKDLINMITKTKMLEAIYEYNPVFKNLGGLKTAKKEFVQEFMDNFGITIKENGD